MEEPKLEVTVSFGSNLPPEVECPRTPLENLVSPSLNQTSSLEVLHTNPLGEPCVLGRQHDFHRWIFGEKSHRIDYTLAPFDTVDP